MIDGNAIAAIIAAGAAGIASVGTLALQFMARKDAKELKLRSLTLETEGYRREKKIDSIHSQVNGRLSELKIRIAKEAYEMGRRFQRDYGDTPSPEFPKPMVEELMRQMEDAERDPIG